MRKILGIDNGQGFKATLYRNTEWDEYVVRFYEDGKVLKDADYHTDDKQDAYDTLNKWATQPSRLQQSCALTDLIKGE